MLVPGNDPFYKGTAAHRRDAEWFAELWERFGYIRGVHLRRAHYQVLSTGSETSNGKPCENTRGAGRRCRGCRSRTDRRAAAFEAPGCRPPSNRCSTGTGVAATRWPPSWSQCTLT